MKIMIKNIVLGFILFLFLCIGIDICSQLQKIERTNDLILINLEYLTAEIAESKAAYEDSKRKKKLPKPPKF